MRVHIVSKHPTEDRILGRLARTLAASTGWTHSSECRSDVDLNYVIPYIYLAERWMDWTATPLAAYFSHYEGDNPGKMRMWARASSKADVRIATAPMYVDLLNGGGKWPQRPTFLCRPPIDPQFRQVRRTDRSVRPSDRRLTVGVSGFSYRNERKGESMIARLLQTDDAGRVRWLTSGEGWPAPLQSHLIAWEEMPFFYDTLDLLLCTSTIEGIPMPPLEALAMGVPVLIPTGVGLLDTLPDTVDGIYRFQAGNEQNLHTVFGATVSHLEKCDYSPIPLRDAVRDYTPEGWAFDHQQAFATIEPRKKVSVAPKSRTPLSDAIGGLGPDSDNLGSTITMKAAEFPVQTPRSSPTMRPHTISIRNTAIPPEPPHATAPHNNDNTGVYVVAMGDQARACAVRLVNSWHTFMADIPIAVAATEPLPGVVHRFIQADDLDAGGRIAKTRIYDLAPQEWEYILYLDADTELVAPVPYLFDLLEAGWEFAICKNPQRFHIARHMERPDNREECKATFDEWGTDEMMQWNGGVFSFRRTPGTEQFFATWHKEWQRWGQRDQAALLRALWRHPMRAVWLGNEWNTVYRYVPPERTAGILHHVEEARRWNGLLPGRLDSPEAWARVAAHQASGTTGVTPSRARSH